MSHYYDAIADGYNALHGEEQRRKGHAILRRVKLRAHDRFLDVGGGTGISTEFFPGVRTLLDPSAELLARAKGDTLLMRAGKLPFGDHAFALAVSITAIHHFDDPGVCLEEMRRVARQVAVTLLKRAKAYDTLDALIRLELPGCDIIDDQHDTIYIWRGE